MATVEFRDGPREVPDHVKALMSGIPTHTLTYDQATEAMNKSLEKGVIDRAADTIVRQHGRDFWGQR